ncbi:myotubularin related protein 14 [Rhinolophus ferrumequinum]|uniref:Myotubularin related protein 14 n=1 Tax=Rhinolophus ferrumequinum TaxID=59479 RepID=A0A7J7UK60_RHIFE|nr:myotubularin related protein 14 [Rhinolophus ferrumequinum]
MAGARAAAAASADSSTSSGNPPPQEPGLGELLEEFSRTQYRAKDCSGTGGSKVERIEKRCLELFGRDYCYSVIQNVNGDICSHYPQHIVFLEYESSEKEKDTFESTVQGAQMTPGQTQRTSQKRTVLFEVPTHIYLIRSEAMTSSCFGTCQSNTSVT